MRAIPELLQVMLDNEEYFQYGLCAMTVDLKLAGLITHFEMLALDQYILSRRPRTKTTRGGFYWTKGEWEPREKWLQQRINRFKS